MGGRDSQGYRIFQELTVKAFLAIRPHADQLVNTVHLMLETGLPSFKGEPTIKRLRDRFQLGLTEKGAAEYMVGVIKNAHENKRSNLYDECKSTSGAVERNGCREGDATTNFRFVVLCRFTFFRSPTSSSPLLPSLLSFPLPRSLRLLTSLSPSFLSLPAPERVSFRTSVFERLALLSNRLSFLPCFSLQDPLCRLSRSIDRRPSVWKE